MKTPNILWICTDQQRFDTLGCYGNRFVRTPNLDRLATEGVLFETAFCQSPVCTPSRASFLTGRYPRTTRCRQNGQCIPEEEVLVTRLLRDAGYACGLSGKLHLSACNPSACKGTERRIDDGYAAFHWSHDPAPVWKANEYCQWRDEQSASHRVSSHEKSEFVQVGPPEELHQTTWCIEKAMDFIEGHSRPDQPWLFSVNMFDPHHPFDPPEEYLEPYLQRLAEIPLPNYVVGELDNKPGWQRIDHGEAYGGGAGFAYETMTADDHRLVRAAYWAMVDLIDRQVGRLLALLEQTGQRQDTLIVFISDHGEMLGDHGIYLKGPYFYEPMVRVPLIISWPGLIHENRRSTGLVELVDLAPTLLEAAGLERHPGMQGISLWRHLTGNADPDHHRDDVYCEYYNAMGCHKDPAAHLTMVRTRRHKLVCAHGSDTGELYDLEEDPGETNNRWDDPDCGPVKTHMLKRLCDRMAWTVDPLPLRVADW